MIDLPRPGPALIAPGWADRAAVAIATAARTARARAEASETEGRDRKAWHHVSHIAEGWRPYEVAGGVAVIGVSGMIVPRWDWIGDSWLTGLNALRLQLGAAFADPEVRGVALVIDSGGGLASGVPDFVDWLAAAKAASGKPLVAVCDEVAYSAAYWIASAADSIAVPRTGGVGSIGVLMMHWDVSGMFEEAGIRITVIQAGARKADGHPFAPLPDEVRARWQAECEDLRRLFADHVARGRAAAGASVDAAAVLATEARTWEMPSGTAEAVASGFADAVMPAGDALAGFVAAVGRPTEE